MTKITKKHKRSEITEARSLLSHHIVHKYVFRVQIFYYLMSLYEFEET